MWHTERLSADLGSRLVSADRDSILAISREEVIDLFSTGAVQFRGFDVTPDSFREFTMRFNRGVISYYPPGERRHVGDGTLTVSIDPAEIAYHGEYHFLPRVNDDLGPPELIWLYCVDPGLSGGETLLCDGLKSWPALSERTRTLLTERRLKYRLDTAAETWRAALGARTRAEVDRILGELPGVLSWKFTPAGTLRWQYATTATVRTRFGGEAFVNSILCAHPTLDDDTEIPRDVIDDILAITRQLTVPVAYEKNDVLLVDNWRCMHGRRNHDSKREIYFRMGMASF